MVSVWEAAAICTLVLLNGCSSSLVGGRHQTINNYWSDGNMSDANMEAASDVDTDADVTVPIEQVGPGGEIPDFDDEDAPEPEIPDEGDGDDGDEDNGEHDEGYAYRPPDGFVFKQRSESDGNTVILDPSSSQQTMSAIGASGSTYPLRFSGIHNGNRAHFRASEIIDDFPLMVSGSSSWTVPGP